MKKDYWFRMEGLRKRKNRLKVLRFVLSIILTIIFLFPVYWIGITSLKTPDEIFGYPPVWFPAKLQLGNYVQLFQSADVRAIWHSLIIASASTLLVIFLGTAAAYSLSRFHTGGRSLAIGILSLRMIPPIALVFPLFLFFVLIRWVDTYYGLIFVYTAMILPYVIWVMGGYVEDIPVELEESAMIDGCSRWMVLKRVVFPMLRNGILATAVFAFVMAMNDFIFALVLTRTHVITFPVQIAHYFHEQATVWARVSALSMLGTLPSFVTVLAMQRYLVRSISMGAIKG
ncbi:MAG: carbohydrate ABC transporter permease [Thermodesulfobacteriota bacterium]